MPDLKSLTDYKAKKGVEMEKHATTTELSGIACPDCGSELDWAEKSLFSTDPPMRRLICVGCGFSEVVLA